MRRFKLTIAYDGTHYKGWQRQLDPIITVQRVVERAAGEILNKPVTIPGSSRTDTGVHAEGQVGLLEVDTYLEPERMRKGINSRLPEDVLITKIEEVGPEFNLRNTKSKRYRYMICAGRDRTIFYRHYVYHYYHKIALRPMREACQRFLGTHDFISFRGNLDERQSTVRTIYSCDILQRGQFLIFHVEGSGFLYHMVRNMVGTVLEVGRGTWEPHVIDEIIAAQDRAAAGPCAPAQGLCLQWIRY